MNIEYFHKLFLDHRKTFTPFHKYVLTVPPDLEYKARAFCQAVSFPACPRLKDDLNPWIHLMIVHGSDPNVSVVRLTKEELCFIHDHILDEEDDK